MSRGPACGFLKNDRRGCIHIKRYGKLIPAPPHAVILSGGWEFWQVLFFFFAYVNFLLLCNEYESTKQQTKRKDFLKEVSRWRSTQADCEYAIAGVGVMLP